jgi:hypothetical protein
VAARRTYTDRDRAIIYAELTVNEGNIKRTARNTGYDVSFVRRCKAAWEAEGVPESVIEEAKPLVSSFMEDAVRIRGKLLIRLEEVLDKGEKATIPQLTTGIGILSDKIRAYEAISEPQRVEHSLALPPAEELEALFAGVLGGVISAAKDRAAAIEAVEEPITTTYRELPAAEDD